MRNCLKHKNVELVLLLSDTLSLLMMPIFLVRTFSTN